MTTKEKERITLEHLKDLIDSNPSGIMSLICNILKQVTDESNAGQINITISNKDDKDICTLLFATDEEMLPLLRKFIDDFDKEKI